MSRQLPHIVPGGPALTYYAGTITSGTSTFTGQLYSARLYANGSDSSFTLSGGNLTGSDTIEIDSGTGFDLNMGYRIRDLAVTHVSGTLDYFVLVTP